MAKAPRTIRMEIASALLALEAKLDENLSAMTRTHEDNAALELIRKAHDALLK